MKIFYFKVNKEHGIHARPAGQLVNIAGKYECDVTIFLEPFETAGVDGSLAIDESAQEVSGKKSASAKGLFGVMSLGVKCGDMISVVCKGKDEDLAHEELQNFFTNNLA